MGLILATNCTFAVCQLVEKDDVFAVFGIDVDGGGETKCNGNVGYIGDLSASILNYVGIPFLQVLFE